MSTCQNCKFQYHGQCRINPPVAHVVGFDPEKNQPLIVTVFPSVRPMEDFCGDHVVNLAIAN